MKSSSKEQVQPGHAIRVRATAWPALPRAAALALLGLAAAAAWPPAQHPGAAADLWAPLVLLLLAPWAEETLLRGAVHATLLERGMGALAANLASALLFGLLHGLARSWMLGALVVLPALAVGWLYGRTRRIAPCAALHATFNASWLAFGAGSFA